MFTHLSSFVAHQRAAADCHAARPVRCLGLMARTSTLKSESSPPLSRRRDHSLYEALRLDLCDQAGQYKKQASRIIFE